MIKIAISGNIASGKSQIENMLIDMGYVVLDCDKVNNDLLTKNTDIINNIKSIFGNDILMPDGNISKQKLSEIIFNFTDKRKKLEDILHKKILEQINIFFDNNISEEMVFVSVPLLFEVNWEKYFDKIIFVSADKKIRLSRLMERNNYTKEQALKRINAQKNEQEKINKSDFVIYNNSDLLALRKSLQNILLKIINMCNKL